MTSETRPVCVYALASLRRNSTKLMIVMCVGIALGLYGIYVQSRSQSNPQYMPTLTLVMHWFYHNIGQRIAHPSTLVSRLPCTRELKPRPLVRAFVQPVTRYSGLLNASINMAQLVLVLALSRSVKATDAIIGLSAAGLALSLVCLAGSFAGCKLMCISCLGVQHAAIIYLAVRRRRILRNILCPSSEPKSRSNSGSSGGGPLRFGSGYGGGAAQAQQQQLHTRTSAAATLSSSGAPDTATQHANTTTTRLRKPQTGRAT